MKRFIKTALLTTFLSIVSQFSFTQSIEWETTLGGNKAEFANEIIATKDGGCIIVGYTQSSANGDISKENKGFYAKNDGIITADYWIVKMDAKGNKEWDRNYGGTDDDYAFSLIPIKEGGYYIAGYTRSTRAKNSDVQHENKGDFDYWILKTDANGKIVWENNFGGKDNDYLNAMIQLKDGGLLCVGRTTSSASGDVSAKNEGGYDYWMLKLDVQGNKIWEKSIPSTDWDGYTNISIAPTKDGGYIIADHSNRKDGKRTESEKPDHDVLLIKCDKEGNIEWQKTYGGSGEEVASAILVTSKGYIVVGTTTSSKNGDVSAQGNGEEDWWIFAVDNKGNKQWDKVYGGQKKDFATAAVITDDGKHIYVGGWTTSSLSIPDVSGKNEGGADYLVMKFDATGNKVWERMLGGSDEDKVCGIIATEDKGCIVVGNTYSSESGTIKSKNKGSQDMWVVKLK